MKRTLVTALFFALPTLVWGQAANSKSQDDDICLIRPNLCDEAPTRRQPAAVPRKLYSRPSPPQASQRPPSRPTCRKRGHLYSIREADLPFCAGEEMQTSEAAPPSAPRTRTQSAFDAYLSANASNPALARRVSGQQAFVPEPTRFVSNNDGSAKSTSDDSGGSSAGVQEGTANATSGSGGSPTTPASGPR